MDVQIIGVISQERLNIAVKLLLSAIKKSQYAASIGTTTDHLDHRSLYPPSVNSAFCFIFRPVNGTQPNLAKW